LRPGHTEVEEIVTKVVAAAEAAMATRLDSLAETVLTLAEPLLRPAHRMAGGDRTHPGRAAAPASPPHAGPAPR